MSRDYKEVLKERNDFCSLLAGYVYELGRRTKKENLEEYAKHRCIDTNFLIELGLVYVRDYIDMLIPGYIDKLEYFGLINTTNGKPIFKDRYLMPIRDVDGNIINLVGYSRNSRERYIYGNSPYYLRRDNLYGLENLKIAYEMGYAILTEGITDCQRLRSLGYNNSFAMCGTHTSEHIINQLSRCRYGVIKIPDRDIAGLKAAAKWNYKKAITLYVKCGCKDVDEYLRLPENVNIFNTYMGLCIDEIKKGQLSLSKEITII